MDHDPTGDDQLQTAAYDHRQLGPYRLVRRIGRGGMGEVYEGWDDRLRRRVAVKLLPPELLSDEEARQRFLREAQAASALDHPNICTVHDVGEDEAGRLYIVMALYEGETLASRLRRGPLPVAEAVAIAREVGRALACAHEAGITHRDVKPANVFLLPGGPVKLLDFGIARVAGEASLTVAAPSPGTPAYMAPEQLRAGAVDARADVWALGVLLHEMIAGERPFRGESAAAALHAILEREAPPLSRVAEGVPAAVEAVVRRALAKDAARRYPSMAALLADLVPEGGAGRTAATPRPELGSPSHRPRRAALAPAMAGVGALLLALALAMVWWSGRQAAPTVTDAGAAGSPSRIAILRFANASGTAELDWLSAGLPELMATELAQNPGLTVVGARRVQDALAAQEGLDLAAPSAEALSRVADEAGADWILSGSFASEGEGYRVRWRLDPPDPRDPSGRGEGAVVAESLIAVVDRLSGAVRDEVLASSEVVSEGRSVAEVTTASPEAWRLYSEGKVLAYASRDRAALPLFERAVKLDPEFALAHAQIAAIQSNLGDTAAERAALENAVRHLDRLPADRRHMIAGSYYGTRWETYDRAAAAFERAVAMAPGSTPALASRGFYQAMLGQYERASASYRQALAGSSRFAPYYLMLAKVLAADGREAEGLAALGRFVADNPANWYGHFALAWYLPYLGQLDEAEERLAVAEELRPGDPLLAQARWQIAVLREDWAAALEHAAAMSEAEDAYYRWLGPVLGARVALFRGDAQAALERLAASREAAPQDGGFAAMSRCWSAEVLLAAGRPEDALAEARAAIAEGTGEWPERRGAFWAALAAEALGRQAIADGYVDDLRRRADAGSNRIEERQLHHLIGRLALDRGEARTAATELTLAAGLLPPRGVRIHWHQLPDHLAIWHDLGRAQAAASEREAALAVLSRVTTSGAERLVSPLAYVGNFASLAELQQAAGDETAARAARESLLSYWPAGALAAHAGAGNVTRHSGAGR